VLTIQLVLLIATWKYRSRAYLRIWQQTPTIVYLHIPTKQAVNSKCVRRLHTSPVISKWWWSEIEKQWNWY